MSAAIDSVISLIAQIVKTFVAFTIDLINNPIVRFMTQAFFAEPIYHLMYVLSSTYVALYAFITDNVPTFLVSVFLFSPFN